jgi:hypothetical protein
MFPAPHGSAVEAIWTDLYFGGTPPAPVQIPYTWISPPHQRRPDKPFTVAAVTAADGTVVRAIDRAARAEHGENTLSVTIAASSVAEAPALAQYVLDFYAQPGAVPRQRASLVVLILNGRTPTEQWRILDVTEGRRIQITDVPSSWPDGFEHQVVEGVRHILDDQERRVEWMTSPVIGSTPGEAGPWFRLDSSRLGGSDVVPF